MPESVNIYCNQCGKKTPHLPGGDPLKMHCVNHEPKGRMTDIERFESNVFYSPDGCWYWTGPKLPNGRGRFFYQGKIRYAHRASFMLHRGDPSTLDVCHTCDNILCVNPNHLFLGTHQDNMDDMVKKGRQYNSSGERNGNHKLSVEQVIAIRQDTGTLHEIAKRHNITFTHASKIRTRKIWTKV